MIKEYLRLEKGDALKLADVRKEEDDFLDFLLRLGKYGYTYTVITKKEYDTLRKVGVESFSNM